MSFLLALLSPALTKCLECCFLTGYAASYSIKQAQQKPKGGLIALPQQSFKGNKARSLPNDPEREGNIWHQYEALEKAKKALEDQLAEERAIHKKELRRLDSPTAQSRTQWRQEDPLNNLPPIKRAEDKTPNELARELSETRSELERMVVEMSDAHNQVGFLQSEKSVLLAENERLRKAAGPNTSKRTSRGTPFEDSGPPVRIFSEEAEGRGKKSVQETMASFGSDIEINAHVLPGGAVADRGASFKDARLPKQNVPPGQAFVGGTISISKLQDMNKKLVEENQRLQTKMLRLDAPATVDLELQEKYNRLVEENNRLQGKLLKLDLLGSPVDKNGNDKALSALQAENAELRDDNDKLVNFLEGLEKRKQELEDTLMSNTGGPELEAAKQRAEQLTQDNAALLDQVERLKAKLKEANLLSTNGSISIPIPVAVDTGEELDKELWVLVEDLRDQNRTLIEELEQLKGRPASELARGNSDSSSDRAAFANLLAEENSSLQSENMRLTQQLSSGIPQKEREVLDEALKSNERLAAEKEKVVAQLKRTLARNTRLVSDNEKLLKQIHSPENISTKTRETLSKADSKGFMSRFSRSLKKKPSKEEKVDSEDGSSVAEPSGESMSDVIKKNDSPSKQLVQDLLDETSKLSEENRRLAVRAELVETLRHSNEQLKADNGRLEQSMITMKELTDDNESLLKENARLSLRIEECLAENTELSAHLIDIALQDDEERIEAALGDGQFSKRGSIASRIDRAAVQQKHNDLLKLMSLEAEQRQHSTETSKKLTSRASKQWQDFETQRSSSLRGSASSQPQLSPWGNVMRNSGSASLSPSEEEVDDRSRLAGGGLRNRNTDQPANATPGKFDLGGYISQAQLQAEGQGNVSQFQAKSTKEKVSRAFYEHCGSDDLGSFLKALGYQGFEPLAPDPSEEQVQAVYQRGLQITSQIQLSQTASPDDKLLAHCTHEQLEEWFLTYVGG